MRPASQLRHLASKMRAAPSAEAPQDGPGVQREWATRARLLAATLGSAVPDVDVRLRPDSLADVLTTIVDPSDRELVWLTLAVMTGVLPSERLVAEVARESEFDNGLALAAAVLAGTTADSARWEVVVARPEDVLVDVSGTLPLAFTTGIQRVIRETVSRWMETSGARPIAWTADFLSIRDLEPAERELIAKRMPRESSARDTDRLPSQVLVPWACTYITPEVLTERARSDQVRSLAQYSRCHTAAIVYDCVPLTSSETLINWAGDTFSWHLSALRHFNRLAAISEAAAGEFRGWRQALAAIGQKGPDITAVSLPVQVADPDEAATLAAHERFVVADLPMVLVVGSAEPRKNHMAVLHAAELLWRAGQAFSVTFIGGRAWGADDFGRRVRLLQAAGRPVEVASGTDDALLYGAYRVARFTVFPSLYEGFGLPAAESLACGTPVITSNFGSMREIAQEGGALMVDPRVDADIAAAMESLLNDDDLLERLRAEALARPERTWDMYAAETWERLT